MPLLWFSLAFVIGILLAANISLPLFGWLIIGGMSILAALLYRTLSRVSVIIATRFFRISSFTIEQFNLRFKRAVSLSPSVFISLAACILSLGALRYRASQPVIDPGFIAWYNDSEAEMVLTGKVSEPPDVRDRYQLVRVQTEQLRTADDILHSEVSGLLLARSYEGDGFRYGDRVVLRGELVTPPENEEFSYRDYLARQGVYSYMPYAEIALLEPGQGNGLKAAIYGYRENALETVNRLFPEPEASLLSGILLGVESGIPEPVMNAFQRTSTSHIIAISGFNITIVSGLFVLVFGRFLGVRRGAIVAAVVIAIYTFLVGADAAVVRAAIMGWIGLLGRQIGRRQAGVNSLAFTAAIMTSIEPNLLWDVGFQLSFVSTLGLVWYAEPLSKLFESLVSRFLSQSWLDRLVGPVGEYLLLTVAAQITTLPLTAYYFRRISIFALPANFMILPAQPPTMIISGMAVLIGEYFHPLGQLLAYLAWPFVSFTIRMVEWFASIEGGLLVLGQVSGIVVIMYYLLLLGITFWRGSIMDHLPTVRPALFLVIIAAMTALTWRTVTTLPDGKMHITLLDVGAGDAILIETPTGRYVLVGGGSSPSRLSAGYRFSNVSWIISS
jgi:competence protein ComEC